MMNNLIPHSFISNSWQQTAELKSIIASKADVVMDYVISTKATYYTVVLTHKASVLFHQFLWLIR